MVSCGCFRLLKMHEEVGYIRASQVSSETTVRGEMNRLLALVSGRAAARFFERMAGAECWPDFVLYACAGRRMQMCLSLVELESFVRDGKTEGKKLKRRPTTQCESGQGRRQRTVTSTRNRSPQSVGVRYQAVRIEGPHRTRLCRTLLTSIMTGKGSHYTRPGFDVSIFAFWPSSVPI